MSKRRLVDIASLTVCESGHVVGVEPTGEKGWQIVCPYCEAWTWESNFCAWCGKALREVKENAR